MKSSFVCFYQAYPPESGAASVTYSSAIHIGGDVTLIQLGSAPRDERTAEGIRVITLPDATASRFQKIWGLRGRIKRIARVVAELSPAVVVLEGASWVLYHWLLLRRLRRTMPGTRVIYHSHNVEYHLRSQKHGRLVTVVTKWAESRVLRSADMSFAVSEVDGRQFEDLYGVRPLLWPNGVNIDQFTRVGKEGVQKARAASCIGGQCILFMGSYAYKPNKEGIDSLVHDIMPLVVEQRPDVRLLILGGQVPYQRDWLINPGVVPFEVLPAIIKSCALGVAPIFSGSGTRLKILEYMAAGLPCVCTKKGAEGIGVEDGVHCIVAETASEFTAGILRCLEDEALTSSLKARAHELVCERYSWGAIMERCREDIGRLSR